jgi:hypothetical protein
MPVTLEHMNQASAALEALSQEVQPGDPHSAVEISLASLAAAARLELATRSLVEDVVVDARMAGLSWRKIAEAVQLDAGSAFRRWKHLDPVLPAPEPQRTNRSLDMRDRRARGLDMGGPGGL